MNKSHSKFLQATALLSFSLIVGTVGYMLIEDYGFIDALFMAVITISTVGYGEVVPLSDTGKLFTSIYIILNLGLFAYVVSMVTSYLVEGELSNVFKNLFFLGREVKEMKNHTIICGFGRNGSQACEELLKNKTEMVIVENDSDLVKSISNPSEVEILIGDATADDILKEAGIMNAASIITTLPSDADNVFISLTAKELNPKIKIIARASDNNSEKKLHRAGATHVVMPDKLGGIHMAQLIAKPYVIEFLELLSGAADESVVLDEIYFDELKEMYHQKSIAELDIRKNAGVTVVGLKVENEGFKFNPDGSTVIQHGDVLIILGNQQKINDFRNTYSSY